MSVIITRDMQNILLMIYKGVAKKFFYKGVCVLISDEGLLAGDGRESGS